MGAPSDSISTSSRTHHDHQPTILVTVGTTRFDALISASLTLPYHLILQYGLSPPPPHPHTSSSSSHHHRRHSHILESYPFKPSLIPDINLADLVISHGGAGTILDVLTHASPSKKLIVVINPDLMDNHQRELAHEMERFGYVRVSTVECLGRDVRDVLEGRMALKAFPREGKGRFTACLEELVGEWFGEKGG